MSTLMINPNDLALLLEHSSTLFLEFPPSFNNLKTWYVIIVYIYEKKNKIFKQNKVSLKLKSKTNFSYKKVINVSTTDYRITTENFNVLKEIP